MSDERRTQLASLSFAEKLKILEKLRERSLAIAGAGLRIDQQDKTTSKKAQRGGPTSDSNDG